MSTTTPKLGLTVPLVGDTTSAWANQINGDLAIIDNLGVTTAPASANQVWAGPPAGSPAAPAFRALVPADIPAGGSGTVTSVGLTAPPEFITGPPVTTAGTLVLAKATQTIGTVYAGPASGAPIAPTFRNLVPTDIPTMTGDSGSGGVKGAVPAPAAGDAAAGKYLKADGTWTTPPAGSGGGGSGTVTSVGLAAPAEFTISGSPVTASGTLTLTKASESANTVWAGPNGSAGVPVFRTLVVADLPAGTDGSVKSVALTMPAEFAVAGSPITTSGTLAVTKANQTANQVYAGPTSGSAVPVFRALVAADIPAIAESQVTNLVSDLAAKAPLASPALTGTPTAPTPAAADNTTTLATTAFVQAAVAGATGGGLPTAPEPANTVLAGPSTGAATAPTFRSLVAADIPASLNPTAINAVGTTTDGLTVNQDVNQNGLSINSGGSKFVIYRSSTGYWSLARAGVFFVLMSDSTGLVSFPNNLDTTTIGGGGDLNVSNHLYFPGGPTKWGMNTYTDGKFYLSDFTHALDAITILSSSGNVGISNDNPTSKLSVSGNADFSGIVALNGGATTPTPTGGDNSTNVATTAFVQNALTSGAYRLNRVLVITTTGTYMPTTGTRALYVETVGGGAAGGGVAATSSNAAAGGGGGSGGYSALWITGAIKASYSVTIGAGGTGVSGSTGNPGTDTTFDSPSICTAKAGAGGFSSGAVAAGAGRGGTGGSSTTGVGDLKGAGTCGQPGIVLSTTTALAGSGGSSIFGGAVYGPVATATGTTNGNAAFPYGAGGSGAVGVNAAAGSGGAGSAGVCRVWEYM